MHPVAPALRTPALLARLLPVIALVLAAVAMPSPASAAGGLSITPLEWNVVGLDSNKPADGPHLFHQGAKVCNTGGAALGPVTVDWTWDTANSAISLSGPSSLTIDSLAASSCAVAYFGVDVVVDAASYNQSRGYRVTASAAGAGSVSTPTPREIYVEKLVSQNRNNISDAAGPTTVTVGDTATYTFSGSTSTVYQQLTAMGYFDPSIFRIVSIAKTVETGGATSTFYSDACGWVNDPTSTDYRSCAGTGKTGGDFTLTVVVKVVGTGTTRVAAMVDDFSGSSYHYNADFSTTVHSLLVTAVNPNAAPAAVDDTKTLDQDTTTTVDVLADDSDTDGDTLTVTGHTNPSHGTVVDNGDGTFDYTPDAGWSGTDTFDYTISDGHDGTDTATVTLTVVDVEPNAVSPSRPRANDDTVTMPKHGRRTTIDVLGNDARSSQGPMTVTVVTGPEHGTATVNADGTIAYEQTEDGELDELTYRICDTQASCSEAQVRLRLRPMVAGRSANRAPVTSLPSLVTRAGVRAAPAADVQGTAKLPATGASPWTTAVAASGFGLLTAGAALLLVARNGRRRVRS